MVAPAAKREAVAHLQATLGMSERRACAVVGADRKSVQYRSCRDDDGDLRSRLRELAQQRRRFGDTAYTMPVTAKSRLDAIVRALPTSGLTASTRAQLLVEHGISCASRRPTPGHRIT